MHGIEMILEARPLIVVLQTALDGNIHLVNILLGNLPALRVSLGDVADLVQYLVLVGQEQRGGTDLTVLVLDVVLEVLQVHVVDQRLLPQRVAQFTVLHLTEFVALPEPDSHDDHDERHDDDQQQSQIHVVATDFGILLQDFHLVVLPGNRLPRKSLGHLTLFQFLLIALVIALVELQVGVSLALIVQGVPREPKIFVEFRHKLLVVQSMQLRHA